MNDEQSRAQSEPPCPLDARIATRYFAAPPGGTHQWMPQAAGDLTPGREVVFIRPSSTALHLHSAWRAAHEAARLQPQIRWTQGAALRSQKAQPILVRQVAPDDSGALFDYFEYAMTSAMSAYAALESFCNQIITERVSAPVFVKSKRKALTPEEIERWTSTDEKLSRIVPDALSLPSPSGKAVWQAYANLKEVRDNVTHFKRKDQAALGLEPESEQTVLYKLTCVDPYEFPEAAQTVLRYFNNGAMQMHWLDSPLMQRVAL